MNQEEPHATIEEEDQHQQSETRQKKVVQLNDNVQVKQEEEQEHEDDDDADESEQELEELDENDDHYRHYEEGLTKKKRNNNNNNNRGTKTNGDSPTDDHDDHHDHHNDRDSLDLTQISEEKLKNMVQVATEKATTPKPIRSAHATPVGPNSSSGGNSGNNGDSNVDFVPVVLTADDEEMMRHTRSMFHTVREQLFYLCSLSTDRGYRVLDYMLHEQLEEIQQKNQSLATAATAAAQSNNGTEDNNNKNEGESLDVNKFLDVSRNNMSLMHVASRMNNVNCIEVLHMYGALIDIQDDLGATPLFYACAHNGQETAVYLLSHGANPNHKDRYSGHPLAICLRNDHLELMKILVLFNADVHLKGQRGNTVLHLACAEGRIKKVRYLLEDCRASVKRTNRDDEHVLFAALPNLSVVEYLCDTAMDLKELSTILSKVSSFGMTVFHKCCEKGYLDTLMALMKRFMNKSENNKRAGLQFLAQRLNEGDLTRGFTPLMYAIMNEQIEMAKFLLTIDDIQINAADKAGDTALHHAINLNHRELCDLLIQYGASVRSKNQRGVACWEAAIDRDMKLNTSEISALEYMWHNRKHGKRNKAAKKKKELEDQQHKQQEHDVQQNNGERDSDDSDDSEDEVARSAAEKKRRSSKGPK